MKIYDTYQEAKIENPDFAIFNYQGKFGTDKDIIDYFDINSASMKECYPADYCITLGELRDLHGGEVGGDVIFGHVSGAVKTILEEEAAGREYDAGNFVLRSSAMEIPTQSPEEKEALDMIDTTSKQVESLSNDSESPNSSEWKNGDECVYMAHNVVHQFIGPCPKREGYGYIQAPGFEVNFVELSKLSKPESPEQKAERELLESAYDLYIAGQESLGVNDYQSFHQFTSDKVQVRFWLGVAGTAGYRKVKQ